MPPMMKQVYLLTFAIAEINLWVTWEFVEIVV